MLFEPWIEIQCGPSSSSLSFEEHHRELVTALVQARSALPDSMWHFKYTGSPKLWTDFVRVRGTLADCGSLVSFLNSTDTGTQLGRFVPRVWDPLAGMLGSHAGLRLSECAAILLIWHRWCGCLLDLFQVEMPKRRQEVAGHARTWFKTGDWNALAQYHHDNSGLELNKFRDLIGAPAAQAGFHKQEAPTYVAGHLFMNSLNELFPE